MDYFDLPTLLRALHELEDQLHTSIMSSTDVHDGRWLSLFHQERYRIRVSSAAVWR